MKHNKNLQIVTAANASFFRLCLGLVLSVRRQSWPSSVPICVLDVGLTDIQSNILKSIGIEVIKPEWDFPDIDQSGFPDWFQAMSARPHLPKYCPDSNVIVWIDCDAWVQSWKHINELVETAEEGLLAITEEKNIAPVIISYVNVQGQQQSVSISGESIQRNIMDCYSQSFGPEVASELGALPSINTGVFALKSDSAAWKIWSDYMASGLKNGFHKLVEQQAINMPIRRNEIAARIFPVDFNYLCIHGLPEFNTETGRFVTPHENKEIGILHLADLKMFSGITIKQLPDNSLRRMPLQYLDILT